MPVAAPTKPFSTYKWRWATYAPTESLNKPPIFLGVLRVFNKFQDVAPSDSRIAADLATVQAETGSSVDLVRTPERNLWRNSRQYWAALGLLEERHGVISLTPFGRSYAGGQVTQVEFAATVIKTLQLPNPNIEGVSEWHRVGLTIKPLELILDIAAELKTSRGSQHSYITLDELVDIIIPLAGVNSSLDKYVEAIIEHREGTLDISSWPDCAPGANDRRIANEFLLFLAYYGFCSVADLGVRGEKRYQFDVVNNDIAPFAGLSVTLGDADIIAQIRRTQLPGLIERKKVLREVTSRPTQALFRRNILAAYSSKCLITGVTVESVLEAAHIKPVEDEGQDLIENGLCLRSDIHQLFDSGHLKLEPNGSLHLSDAAARTENYGHLPARISLPEFVDPHFIEWRAKYY